MAIGIVANDEKNKLHGAGINKYYDSSFQVCLEDDNESHAIVANNISPNSKVLDIGCAQGLIGSAIAKKYNCKFYGIELDEESSKIAEKTNSYEKIYKFDICDKKNKEYKSFFEENIEFDYIIFSDVLEHLLYPGEVLYEFSSKLKKDGKVLISLPNIAHYDVVDGLLNEKFNYSEMGILDNTHLRFFTKYSFAEYIQTLNEDEKYSDFKFDLEIIGKTVIEPSFIGKYEYIDSIIRENPQLFVLQNIFKLTKIDVNKKTHNLDKVLSESRKNVTESINRTIVEKQNNIDILKNKVENLENEKNFLFNENCRLTQELNDVYNSNSWKVTKPMRKISQGINNLRHKSQCQPNNKKSILYFVLSWLDMKNVNNTHIGGTTLHLLELIKNMEDDYNIYVVTAINNKYVLISFENGNQIIRDLNIDVCVYQYDAYHYQFLHAIYQIIDELQIDFVHIQHIINFPCDLQYIAKKVKVILTLHDYSAICPTWFLIDENNRYCEKATTEKCITCCPWFDLQTRNIAINNLLKSVDKIIVPDLSVEKEIRKYYNYDKFMVIPNGIDINSFSKFIYSDKKPGEIKNIAFVGGLNINKGSELAKNIIKHNDENIKYHLFGTSSDKFFLKNYSNYKYHGEYSKKDLPKLLNDNHIDLVLMLSVCPESFSYVLSETIYAKTPVIALDIGAIGSRVKQMDIGLVLDYNSNYKDIIDSFNEVFKEENYSKYIKNLERANVPKTDGMVKSVKEIYNTIEPKHLERNCSSIDKFLKKYQIKYKIEGLEWK